MYLSELKKKKIFELVYFSKLIKPLKNLPNLIHAYIWRITLSELFSITNNYFLKKIILTCNVLICFIFGCYVLFMNVYRFELLERKWVLIGIWANSYCVVIILQLSQCIYAKIDSVWQLKLITYYKNRKVVIWGLKEIWMSL